MLYADFIFPCVVVELKEIIIQLIVLIDCVRLVESLQNETNTAFPTNLRYFN